MVEAFTDPILASDRYVAGLYDLLILDIKMPRMNGFDLYKNIKRNDPNVNTCFLTALSDLDVYQTYLRSRFIQNLVRGILYSSQLRLKNCYVL